MFSFQTGCSEENCTDLNTWDISHTYAEGLNIGGLVMISVCVGIAGGLLRDRLETLKALVNDVNAITMMFTAWIITCSPGGVFFLIISKFLGMDVLVILQQMGFYFITVLFGIAIHMLIVLPLVSYLVTHKNPYIFMANMGESLAIAFGTASSSAALPLTMKCCEVNNGLHKKIVGFVIPIGATVNMNGTALYQAVAAIFISQVK